MQATNKGLVRATVALLAGFAMALPLLAEGQLRSLTDQPIRVAEAAPAAGSTTPAATTPAKKIPVPGQKHAGKGGGTADHSKFPALKGPFLTGPDVTKACLTCHTEASKHFMKSIHWTWEYTSKAGQQLGKKHLVNNFCTNARGNEGMCAQCHAGYGWKDETFDFNNQENVDCLVCHDRTRTYYKTPNTKGNEACSIMFEGKPLIDYVAVAQSVGLPGRENCGTCHFNGGGGDGVKHGDLDSSLIAPEKALDVHMDAKGPNFACTACHVSDKHLVAGSRYEMMASDAIGRGKPGERRDVASCESCHGNGPHKSTSLSGIKLNDHTNRVACQTCHIPTIARGGVATMVDWDWRTAGRTKNGVGFHEEKYTQRNGAHRATYKSIKGSFVYDEDFKPEYSWFNGAMRYTTIDTKFDSKSQPVAINAVEGSPSEPGARIWPFKIMRTVMPYDAKNETLVYTHLWGEDDAAFWGNYDFKKAVAKGMQVAGKPYSGELGFIPTVSYWPITHMVAPKSEALGCEACHAKDGRLAKLAGFYMPGGVSSGWSRYTDLAGLALLFATLTGVLIHAALRLVARLGRARS